MDFNLIFEEGMDVGEKQKLIDETTQETKAAIDKILSFPTHSSDSMFVKYRPLENSAHFNSGAKERMIRVVETPMDILKPPKFKHKRVPKSSDSPPVPVMRSPPRPVTVKDQQDWKIPSCVSNWKNPKGYIIPCTNNGEVLQEVQINHNFSKLSEALYVAEEKAREAVVMRVKVQRERMMKEKEKNGMELRDLAQKARLEKTGVAQNISDMKEEGTEEMSYRDKIREERRKERNRDKNGAVSKKAKISRDRDRDVSENIALGMATTGGKSGVEVMYDERLFNQEKGMDSGFGADDCYTVYDKGLFTTQSTISALYKLKKEMDDHEMYGGADEQPEKLRKTDQFKPGRAFEGTTERSGHRERPVEFEKDKKTKDDIFGLDKFLTDLRTGKKNN